MAKNKTSSSKTLDEGQDLGGFPIPFTLESLRADILTLYFQQARTIAWMSGADAFWKLVERKLDIEESAAFDPDITPKDIGFDYVDIAHTEFAKSIETMYQYAYFGIQDESVEPLDYESIHMWISAILSDMANSRVGDEWESYGATALAPAQRCLEVAELANARRVLEGSSDNFFHFSGKGKDDDAVGLDSLTIRQMSLLAGMEEMSIRAAANPKRANPLKTFSDEGRTRIRIDDAKTWLISKGRYVQIKHKFGAGDIDLSKRKIKSQDDLEELLYARLKMISLQRNDVNQVIDMLVGKGILTNHPKYPEFIAASFRDQEKMAVLAEALDFNPTLLWLRVREALANQELLNIERELRMDAQV